MSNFDGLLDPFYRKYVIDFMKNSDWLQEEREDQIYLAKNIKRLIVTPVSHWLSNEWIQTGGRSNTATEAGQVFVLIAEDMIYELENQNEIYPEIIDNLNNAWEQFQIQLGWAGILEAKAAMPILKRDAIRQKGCRNGGVYSGLSRHEAIENRNQKIIAEASRLLADGKKPAPILAKRFNLSERQIRNIVKKSEMK